MYICTYAVVQPYIYYYIYYFTGNNNVIIIITYQRTYG